MRRAGVLVRTMDLLAEGRSPPPHAVRISLNANASMAQLGKGLGVVAATLSRPPASGMEP